MYLWLKTLFHTNFVSLTSGNGQMLRNSPICIDWDSGKTWVLVVKYILGNCQIGKMSQISSPRSHCTFVQLSQSQSVAVANLSRSETSVSESNIVPFNFILDKFWRHKARFSSSFCTTWRHWTHQHMRHNSFQHADQKFATIFNLWSDMEHVNMSSLANYLEIDSQSYIL